MRLERQRVLCAALGVCLLSGTAFGEEGPQVPAGHPPVSAAMPAGHPPTTTSGAPSGRMPAGHPPTTTSGAPSGRMPAGHPPAGMAPGAHGAAGGHGAMGGGAPAAIRLEQDSALAAGEVAVVVLNAGHFPLEGAVVTLRETVQSIAEGDAKREQVLRTGPDGSVLFRGIDHSVRAIARVSVQALGAEYAVEDFRPSESTGMRVIVPVYESTPDPTDAMVGMRGFVYVQLREGEFVFDVLFRVFSLGQKTWVPGGIRMDLPAGLSAFESASPGVVQDGAHGARLTGSFPPGQKDVRLNFRLPAGQAEEETFRFSLPPHVAEMRVITESAPGMSLEVPGFEPVQEARGPEGTRVLVTRRALAPGEGVLSSLEVRLSGLPTVGPERWYAVALAIVLALGGLWLARRAPRSRAHSSGDLKQARRLILADLAALEAARAADEVGPQTYERARRELLLALARLEEPGQPGATATA